LNDDLPILDQAMISALLQLETPGKPSVLLPIVDTFLADAARHLDSIRAGSRTGDTEAISLAAHSLKGTAGSLGAARLAKVALDIESHRSGVVSETTVDALEDTLTLTRSAYDDLARTLQPGSR
jgi:HPt (histidine-containing phosphotransfer) domain-containing protein